MLQDTRIASTRSFTPKEAPTAAGSAPKDVLQALSTHLAEGSVLGAKSWLR
jgi:hypothetical protein